MNISRGYDQLSHIYRLVEFIAFGRALERARFHHFSQLRDCKRILLLGDGDGRGLALACRVAPHARIDSIDFSAGMLARAARRLRPEDRARVTLRQADALAFNFPADTYDAVTTFFYATNIHDGTLGLGKADNSLARIPDIKGELMMVWGRQDPHVPGEGRAKIYTALTAAGTTFPWHEFNGAHAFLRDEGLRYDAELARLTLGMTVDFFRSHLA